MAAPNIISLTTITGKTGYLTPANSNAAVIVANSANSNAVYKVNTLVAANLTGTGNTAVNVTVAINSLANGGGTGYPICSTVSVPANASVIIVDKENMFYLEEDKSVVITSGSANNIAFTISYEEMS